MPVFANGSVLFHSDIERLLAATGADAVMSATGALCNPALFSPAPHPPSGEASSPASKSPASSARPPSSYLTGAHPRHTALALEYLDIVKTQKTPTPTTCVNSHLFQLLRPGLSRERDLQARLGRATCIRPAEARWEAYEAVIRELDERMEVGRPCTCCLLIARAEVLV